MQKMIFSAVALVAFSFAGMANESKEKKVEVERDCCAVSDAAFDKARNEGHDSIAASNIALAVYNACNKINSKKTRFIRMNSKFS